MSKSLINIMTTKYLTRLATLLDHDEEVPKGMTVSQHVHRDGKVTLDKVVVKCKIPLERAR